MIKSAALIIDDEPDIRELLEITLNRMHISCESAMDLKTAKLLLKERMFDLCLTDMRLPDGDGVEFVSYVQKHYPKMPVAVITAHGNMETAIQALKYGAFDFINKPVDLSVLRALVNNALRLTDRALHTDRKLVGNSDAIRQTRQTIAKLARSQAPIYISGESGTGKELVARMIHEEGPRAMQAFVPVNCGAIPYDLMESEFFGHRKGSFTGADSDKIGLFQAAEGGSLFLDEVAELPQDMQVKLLRAIQEKKIRSLGSQQEVPVNVRILSATHKNLAHEVDAGNFRRDLYYRINVIELNVPPLRERKEDIPEIVHYILGNLGESVDGHGFEISGEAMEALTDYAFPGNVRELENILERATTLCERSVITMDDLKLQQGASQLLPAQELMEGPFDLEAYLENIERKSIQEGLEKNQWNLAATADYLGTSLRSLRYRIQKLQLKKDDNHGPE
jgi:two-component system response regulator PilR (NtrC family)